MRRDDLNRLADELSAASADAPFAITITLPTHRHAPDNAQDPIRVRTLARTAKAALDQLGLTREQRSQLDAQLDGLGDEVDAQVGFNHTDLGLGCYLVPGTTRIVRLGHNPPERVIVSDEFSLAAPIADVVAADDVDVLALSTGGGSTDGARLYRLAAGELVEHQDDVFPASWDIRDRSSRFSEGRVDSPKRDAHIEGFLRSVDGHLLALFGNPHDRQLAVVGIERLRSHWRAVATSPNLAAVAAELDGNFDKTPVHELAALVAAAVADAREGDAAAQVAALDDAPVSRVAGGTDDTYRLASTGRVATLLVEEGATDEIAVDGVVIGDRVARTIRAAYDTGADIVIAPAGTLTHRGGIAALARW